MDTPETQPDPRSHPAPGSDRRVAYLVNEYPKVSHAFIRREIQALEAIGWTVERFTVQPPDALSDPGDQAEAEKTAVLLDRGVGGLLGPTFTRLRRRPAAWIQGLVDAARYGFGSDRGLLRNLVYFAEACRLAEDLEARGLTHVHAHFATNPAMVAMLAAGLSESLTYSFTLHGPEDFDRPLALRLAPKVAGSEFVSVISSFTRGQLFRWAHYPDWHKVKVVHCGLDDGFLEDAKRSGPVPDTRRLVCIGRLCEQKGQQLLVEAAGLLKERGVLFELDLVGDGPMRKDVELAIAGQGVEGLVHITGYVSSDEVRRRLEGSRAMVLGSFAEGLPVVIMEALAVGRPVITTFLAGIPELVDRECGWLVPMGDPAKLADAMQAALDTPLEQLTRMGDVGRERVWAEHRAITEAKKLAALFLEAMGRDGEAEAFVDALDMPGASEPTAESAVQPAVGSVA